MKIKIKLNVSETARRSTIDLSDLGYSKDEWDTLGEDKKQTAIQELVDSDFDQPYWSVVNFDETS